MALSNYKVIFSVDKISMAQQEHIYKVLMDNLTPQEKDKLSIVVIDGIGGKHFVFEDYGIEPITGTVCKDCRAIDCEMCVKHNG